MNNFKKTLRMLTEQLNTTDLAIFTGRFQGFNVGHQTAINKLKSQYKRTVVFIVEGKNTSENKDQNPFSAELRKQMVQEACSGVDVYIIPNGFLPGAIKYLDLVKPNETVVISSGEDRIDSYKSQFKTVPYSVEFIQSDRPAGVSGTMVRKSLKDNDFAAYKKVAAKGLDNKNWFDKLREAIKTD